jgi:DNA-binding MarR family transcriptional regulator
MDTPHIYQITPGALLEVCMCHMTRRAARALTRAYDAALAETGLTAAQFTLLAAIAAAGSVAIADLSGFLFMEASTLSRNLQALRKTGFVQWREGAGRRPARISLSETGHKTLAAAIPAWQEAQRGLTQRLGSGKAGALLENLETAARALAV